MKATRVNVNISLFQTLEVKTLFCFFLSVFSGSKALLNYLKKPEEMKNFLMNDINLSPAVADAILNSNIDPQEVRPRMDAVESENGRGSKCHKRGVGVKLCSHVRIEGRG